MPNFGIESHKLRQRVWQQKAKQDSHQIVSCTNRIQEATGQEELAESTSLSPRLVGPGSSRQRRPPAQQDGMPCPPRAVGLVAGGAGGPRVDPGVRPAPWASPGPQGLPQNLSLHHYFRIALRYRQSLETNDFILVIPLFLVVVSIYKIQGFSIAKNVKSQKMQ